MKKLLLILLCLGLVGCATIKSVIPLTQQQELSMGTFSDDINKIGTGMSPQEVKDILGEPSYIDKETDIHIKGQDTVWTYEHPVIAVARFIVIFRDGGVELSTIAVKDVNGVLHYLTREEFGK